jgi:hypothetical protein
MLCIEWYAASCPWLDRFQHFGKTCCLRREGRRGRSWECEWLYPVKRVYINSDTSAVYHLRCQDRPLVYIGQTERHFHVRYREHPTLQKQLQHCLRYHLINYGHCVDHMKDIADIIFTTHKGNTFVVLK